MVRGLFFGSATTSLLCTLLVLFVDAETWGVQEEPSTILYYGGLGLLAGFAGLVAALSGVYWFLQRLKE